MNVLYTCPILMNPETLITVMQEIDEGPSTLGRVLCLALILIFGIQEHMVHFLNV
jgi:hypothetical protein